MSCPCGFGADLDSCCGPLLAGVRHAATAEQLMRSRFTAYKLGDEGYIRETWHPQTCPKVLDLDESVEWTRLDVVSTSKGGLFDSTGVVEFRAYFRVDGQRDKMHEISEFVRLGKSWVYVSGRHT